jgi:hypothetical protein
LTNVPAAKLSVLEDIRGQSTFREVKAKALGGSVPGYAYGTLKKLITAADSYSKSHDRMTFDDRRTNATVLVAMLIGYKPDLWPLTMPRFKRALPPADVCLVSPGMRSDALADLCRAEGWSYLSTATNDVSLAQNVCYRMHDAAEMIVKLDEDMFLLSSTISDLLLEYKRLKNEGVVDPSAVAPMIPLNGFCYRYCLEALQLLDEYESLFGVAKLGTSGLAIHTKCAAARWMWERTSPLEVLSAQLANKKGAHLFSPIQFSIGMIAFERKFWEAIGYFSVSRRRLLTRINTLGSDEACLCSAAMHHARPIITTYATVAGHFSFGPQYRGMLAFLKDNRELFA